MVREVHKGHQHSAYRYKALNAVKNVSVTGSIIYLEMIHRKNVLKRIKKVQVLYMIILKIIDGLSSQT